MKKIIYIINCALIVIIPTILFMTPIKKEKTSSEIDVNIKQVKSEIIKVENITKENKISDESKEDNKIEQNSESIKYENENNTTKEETKKEIIVEETKLSEIIETQIGKMSGYGPNCNGCSGYLSSGNYVGDGNVYYNDKTYGNIRIVAGDYKYKFGSIIRIKNSKVSSNAILAIVLDRGSSIGIDKKYMFDLLFPTEQEALKYEVSYNVTFEILRIGY